MIYSHLSRVSVSDEVINNAIRRQQAIVGSESEIEFTSNIVGSFDDVSESLSYRLTESYEALYTTWLNETVASVGRVIATLNDQTWENTVARVIQMLSEYEEDPDYVYVPAIEVVAAMLGLLAPAIKKLTKALPRPLLSPDGSGGLRFEWRIGDKQLRVIFRVGAVPYIYHQVGEKYEIEAAPNSDQTAYWLDWLSTT